MGDKNDGNTLEFICDMYNFSINLFISLKNM